MPGRSRSNDTFVTMTGSWYRSRRFDDGSSQLRCSSLLQRNGRRTRSSGSKPRYRTKPGNPTSPTSGLRMAPTLRRSARSMTIPDTPCMSHATNASQVTPWSTPTTIAASTLRSGRSRLRLPTIGFPKANPATTAPRTTTRCIPSGSSDTSPSTPTSDTNPDTKTQKPPNREFEGSRCPETSNW